jgi:ribosomal protein S18 acetylase RimI-like enzyme
MSFERIIIREVSVTDLQGLVGLFAKYLQFYKRKADANKMRQFLETRLRLGEAKILLAFDEDHLSTPLAFVLLYPGFSSLSLGKIYILNDLFVEEYARHSGIARKLIDASRKLAKKDNALRLDLSTANDNIVAQKLYELYGFKKDEIFCNYTYSLN